ncbi:MAG: hypothetical protein K2P69_07115 [Eubacterium sp.]|nr:hypothetical protein [Eubacterium sp.]
MTTSCGMIQAAFLSVYRGNIQTVTVNFLKVNTIDGVWNEDEDYDY